MLATEDTHVPIPRDATSWIAELALCYRFRGGCVCGRVFAQAGSSGTWSLSCRRVPSSMTLLGDCRRRSLHAR